MNRQPTHTRIESPFMKKYRARKEAERLAEEQQRLEAEREWKEERKDMILLAIFVPLFLVLGYVGFVFIWSITPPEWW